MYPEIEWRGLAWDARCRIGMFRLLKHPPNAEHRRPLWIWGSYIEEQRDADDRLGIVFMGVKEFFGTEDHHERTKALYTIGNFFMNEDYSYVKWLRVVPVHRIFTFDLDLRRKRCLRH